MDTIVRTDVAGIATRHYQRQRLIARRAADRIAALWRQVDPGNIAVTWREQSAEAARVLTAAQYAAAGQADAYLAAVTGADTAGAVIPGALAGVASDGRPLLSLLRQPTIASLLAIGRGVDVRRSMGAGALSLDMLVRTQIADAGRTADGIAIAARPRVTGWTRMVVPPSCSRCLILAGRRYKWNQGFKRHPRCDCRHIPTAEDDDTDPQTSVTHAIAQMTTAERVETFGKVGAQAIGEGADPAQVVNARRGMTEAGERQFTTVNARRGPRPMPEQIYRDAQGSRDEAIRLLRLHRYIR